METAVLKVDIKKEMPLDFSIILCYNILMRRDRPVLMLVMSLGGFSASSHGSIEWDVLPRLE